MEKLTQRSLVYDEGTSDKFWSIRVDGLTHTVHYGRVGTAGQVKAKAFDTGDAAVAAAEKLINDKLRKGYRDAGQPGEMPDPVPAEATRAPVAVEVVDEPAPALVAPVAIADDVRPALDLLPHEWSLATWRPLHEAPAAEPRPFDPKRLREAVRTVNAEQARWGWWNWPSSPVSFPMTREEAAYWLRLGQRLSWRMTPLKRHAAVLEQGPDISADEAIELARDCQLPEGEVMAPLLTLLGTERMLELLLTPRRKPSNEGPALDLFSGVRAYLMPLLSDDDQDRLRARAHDWLEEELHDPEYVLGDAATLAAQVGGLYEQVEEVCARWPDGWFSESGAAGSYISIALGARSAEAFEAVVERTKMRLTTDREVAGWLAHTELRRLDWLVTSALRQESRDAAASAVGALADRVHAVEAAQAMLELQMSSRAPSVAREWLTSHPAQTARGLIPLLSRSGQLADAARDELKRVARGPARPLLEDLAGELAGPDRTRLQQRVLDAALPAAPELEDAPDWLDEATGRIKQTALPAWLEVTALPSLEVDGGSLGPRHLPAVLRLLRTSAAVPDPGLAHVRRSVSPASAEEFAWALFDAWMTADSPSKDKWALLAMGHIGGDHCATRLAPLIRAWPGESQHKRAVLGLDVLRGIGSDVALMQLNGIAQKLKFKALQGRAREAMEEIARGKGMTKGELEDRIVPDCGLDEHGQRVFDFGPRRFEFVLGPGMKPMLRDGAGKLRTSPPKPGAKDDEALATAAVADWKLMRKTVADVAKVQGARLEQAMVGGRRWSGEDFETLLARHPLQRHLVRLLVLATYQGRAVSATFRLTEEGDYADSDDEPFALPDDAQVGVVHPMHLSSSQQAEWGELLADYEIVPPFPQLGRPVYDVEPDELDGGPITRFGEYRIPPGPLVRILENLDWSRGVPQDAGMFHLHSKYFPGGDCTAVLQYESGIPTGYIMEAESQKLTHLYVVPGEGRGWDFGYGLDDGLGRPTRWRDVDPVVRSEVLSDVHHLLAKAES